MGGGGGERVSAVGYAKFYSNLDEKEKCSILSKTAASNWRDLGSVPSCATLTMSS